MSKKLLSEAQVRRFQSLASIKPLNEMYNEEKEEPMEEAMQEEEVDEGYAMKRDEEPMAEEMEDDGDVDVDMGADGEDDDDVEIEEEMVEKAQMAMKDLQALVDAQTRAAAAIIDGDYSDESLLRAEELSQVLRGVLMTRPEPVQEEREPREAAPDVLDNLPE